MTAMPHSLDALVAASAEAKYCTPAQFDHALAEGVSDAHARMMLVCGATHLAEAEHHSEAHPDGLIGILVHRREAILDAALDGLHARRLMALALNFDVIAHGDDEEPPTVVYAATRSTGAGWADELL